jgi:hypothetical protein
MYEIRKVSNREWRLFLDGKRTAYSGDTYEQALKMKLHLEGSFKTGETWND